MTAAEALVRLKRMVAWNVAPTIDAAELATLLTISSVVDVNRYAPTAAQWTPTYDLNRGAAEGWRWKAAAVAAQFDFKADGGEFSRDQVLQHCLAMVKQYAAKIISSPRLAGATALSPWSDNTALDVVNQGGYDVEDLGLNIAGSGPATE